MRECQNIDVRDRLPDLLHERLMAAERERVLLHVAGCADCTAELAWLRTARETMNGSHSVQPTPPFSISVRKLRPSMVPASYS